MFFLFMLLISIALGMPMCALADTSELKPLQIFDVPRNAKFHMSTSVSSFPPGENVEFLDKCDSIGEVSQGGVVKPLCIMKQCGIKINNGDETITWTINGCYVYEGANSVIGLTTIADFDVQKFVDLSVMLEMMALGTQVALQRDMICRTSALPNIGELWRSYLEQCTLESPAFVGHFFHIDDLLSPKAGVNIDPSRYNFNQE